MAFEPTNLTVELAIAWLEGAGFRVRNSPLVWHEWSNRPRAREAREQAAADLPGQERQIEEFVRHQTGLLLQINEIISSIGQARDRRTQIGRLRHLLQQSRQARNQAHRRYDPASEASRTHMLATIESLINTLDGAAAGDPRATLNRMQSLVQHLLAQLNRERSALRTAAARNGVQLRNVSEQAQLNRDMLLDDPPERLDNPEAVTVNFQQTGVRVQFRGPGGAMDNGPVDPVLAVAVVRFLEAARAELGIEAVYSSGFNRPPMGPHAGYHSQGKSWDILGFRVLGADLHLRRGLMIEPGQPNFDTHHSDWFDTRPLSNGRTRAGMMREFVAVLSRFFGHIIGPGHDALHDAHFHADTVDHQVSVDIPATRDNPRPYAQHHSQPVPRDSRLPH